MSLPTLLCFVLPENDAENYDYEKLRSKYS
jgi:hypothetical protein